MKCKVNWLPQVRVTPVDDIFCSCNQRNRKVPQQEFNYECELCNLSDTAKAVLQRETGFLSAQIKKKRKICHVEASTNILFLKLLKSEEFDLSYTQRGLEE